MKSIKLLSYLTLLGIGIFFSEYIRHYGETSYHYFMNTSTWISILIALIIGLFFFYLISLTSYLEKKANVNKGNIALFFGVGVFGMIGLYFFIDRPYFDYMISNEGTWVGFLIYSLPIVFKVWDVMTSKFTPKTTEQED